MANNYCDSSSAIPIPAGSVERAKEIIEKVVNDLEESEDEGYCGFSADVEKGEGGAYFVWLRGDESINPDHAEILVRKLVEELHIEGIQAVSWAYTRSKPRIDEFGGGAFAIHKGVDTVWVDAANQAERLMAKKLTQKVFEEKNTMETGAALEIVFDMARLFRAGVTINPELNSERQDQALAVIEDFITNKFDE